MGKCNDVLDALLVGWRMSLDALDLRMLALLSMAMARLREHAHAREGSQRYMGWDHVEAFPKKLLIDVENARLMQEIHGVVEDILFCMEL